MDDGTFAEVPEGHDDGEKTVLGTKGKFNGTAQVELLLKQACVADRLAMKPVRLFFGDAEVSVGATKQSEGLRERSLDLGWAVGTVLRSRLFFADSNVRNGTVRLAARRRRTRAGSGSGEEIRAGLPTNPVRPGIPWCRSR